MPTGNRYQFGDLTLDTGQRRVTRGEEHIELSKLTYTLLVALVEAAPNVLSHDDLVQRIWRGRATSPETVMQRVKLLRDALGDDAEAPRYVALVRGHGYRIVPTVDCISRAHSAAEPTPPIPKPDSAAALTYPPRRSWRRGALAAIVIAAAAMVLASFDYGTRVVRGTGTEPPAAASALPTPSVGVLPFVNDSPEYDQQRLADGLSAALVNALHRVPGLEVPGYTSSLYFRGRNADPAAIAAALNVQHLLGGSIQRSGDRVRITAELLDASTHRRLWGTTYERGVEDIFAIQDDITEHVAAALQITLGVGRLGRIPGMPRNAAAYEELLKGDGYLGEARAESFQPAIDHYLRATQLDESSSVAWISLANAYSGASAFFPQRLLEYRRNANEAADRARALTPNALHVLVWDARRNINRGNWSEAAVFFDEQLTEERFPFLAREYGPSSAPWALKGFFLLQVGRVNEAVSHLERARAADPLLPQTARFLGDAYAATGALGDALAEFDRGLQLGSDAPVIQGYALAAALATGDRTEIDRRLAAMSPSPATDMHLRMARFLDDPATAIAQLRELTAPEPSEPDLLTNLILAHWAAYYGDAPTALSLLKRIPREAFTGDIVLALWRPLFSDARKLPEFNELVRELGLVDYWRTHAWPDFCTPAGESFTCR